MFYLSRISHHFRLSGLVSKSKVATIDNIYQYGAFLYVRKRQILDPKERKQVASALKNPRDKTLFLTGLYTSLRISKLISIKQKQIFTASDGVRNLLTLVRPRKKMTVCSNIPIHPKLREQLLFYKKAVLGKLADDDKASPWRLPSTDDHVEHIGGVRAHNILTASFNDLGVEGASTHSTRRTCLTSMSRIPLWTIQEISSHANLS
jgi:integrase/recombinase XerD